MIRALIASLRVPDEHREAFRRELANKRGPGLWTIGLLGTVLFPLFLLLDWFLYPEAIWPLGISRAITTGLGALFLIGLRLTDKAGTLPQHSHRFVWLFALIFCGGLDAVIYHAGGIDTPYYAGMNLALIGISAAIPLRTGQMALLLAAIVIQLNVLMLTLGTVEDLDMALNANFFLWSTMIIGVLVNATAVRLRIVEFLSQKQIEIEKAKNEELLLNILPHEVANELKAHGRVRARHIKSCSILFSDFVGFTNMSRRVDPAELVHSLDRAFSHFDDIMERQGLEKLKTIGDAYMCAGGVLGDQPDHLVSCVLAGLEMLDVLEHEDILAPDGSRWEMRLGIHCGPVVAGVIGNKKFAYDLWGDTVNTAARMESTAQPSSVNMASEVFDLIQEFFVGVDRGFIPVRGKGPVSMTRLTRLRPRFSRDQSGRQPNAAFFDALERWLNSGKHLRMPPSEPD
ncbi:MAG: adenylate/guanylate cyclase domain-containing protein [Deltaproteobacteria bacterium]|nr:adenylate/guanylate cyclase domain-containing protein [Deltaproteobacteria bacterium]